MSIMKASEFVTEAREHLSEICHQLLQMERGGGAGLAGQIEAALRAVHSIKGGAGFLGLRPMEELFHAFESALEGLLAQGTPPAGETIDLLLQTIDRGTSMIENVERGESIPTGDLLPRLEGVATLRPGGSEGAVATAASAAPEPVNAPAGAIGPDPATSLDPESGPSSTFEVRLDLTRLQRAKLGPLEVVEKALEIATVEAGRIESPISDRGAFDASGPVMWWARVRYPGTAAEFLERLGLPPEPSGPVAPVEPAELHAASATRDAPSPPEPPRGPAELRGGAPVSIRIPLTLADRLVNLAGELVLVRNQSRRFTDAKQTLPPSVAQRFDSVTTDLQASVLETRMQPVGNLFQRFPRLVRDLARQLGKRIEIEIEGADLELDKTILDAISDPLTHLVRNACDHGVEKPEERVAKGKPPVARLQLRARHIGDHMYIDIEDDGRGIDREAVARKAQALGLRTGDELSQLEDRDLLALILLPGFSTASQVTDLSGRGVGMDVVRSNVSQLGGFVEIYSQPNRGTTFSLRLPLTLAIIPSLLVTIGGDRFAIPQRDVEGLVSLDAEDGAARLEWTREQPMIRLRGRLMPLVRFPCDDMPRRSLNDPAGCDFAPPTLAVILKLGSRRFALTVDQVLTSEEIVVKPMHTELRWLECYAGATILGDGGVALILRAEGIARLARARFTSDSDGEGARGSHHPEDSFEVLVVEQTGGVRVCVPLSSIRRVVMFDAATVQRIARDHYLEIDGMPTRLVPLTIMKDFPPTIPAEGTCFGLVPREPSSTAAVVRHVHGTKRVLPSDVRPVPDQTEVLGAVMLSDGMTPIVGLSDRQGGLDEQVHPARAIRPARILLVDDTAFFREMVGHCLRWEGYEVETANDGGEALRMLRRQRFDLVVSDWEMPNLDGLALARTLRADEGLRPLPLLALTTLAGDEYRRRALEAGFDALEVKFDRASFLATVSQLLSRYADGSLGTDSLGAGVSPAPKSRPIQTAMAAGAPHGIR